MAPGGPEDGGTKDLSGEYSEAMKTQMGSTLTYRHEDGMNYARTSPRLLVGSCLQRPEDVDALLAEKVGVIFCLQEDKDMAHFGLDLAPIQQRAKELGVAHAREPIKDFDPFSLRRRLPTAVARLARELGARPEDQSAYIHCTAGLGRAPGVALAYRFWLEGACLDEAYAELFKARRCHPQLGMIRAAACDMLAGDEGSLVPTRLVIAREAASTVEIAGLDVGWGSRLALEWDAGNKEFALKRGLPPGSYQYKFIVDGEWLANPDLPTVDDNGNINNVVDVAPEAGSPDAERRARLMAAGGRPTADELSALRVLLLPPPA